MDLPETRLSVAQLCQSLLKKSLLKTDTPEATYISALLRDLLWSEMERMTGRALQEPPVPQPQHDRTPEDQLSPEEVASVRLLLEDSFELRELAVAFRGRGMPLRQEDPEPTPQPPPARRPTPVQQVRQPTPPPARPRRGAIPKTIIPMPPRHAMNEITAQQSATAVSMSNRIFSSGGTVNTET